MTTCLGMVNALRNLLRVCPGGLLYMGLPCNSHSFMSSSQHQRDWHQPLGDQGVPFVQVGNQIAYRSCLMIVIALVRGLYWFLENPGASKCVVLPVIQQLLNTKRLGTIFFRWCQPHLIGSSFSSYRILLCRVG